MRYPHLAHRLFNCPLLLHPAKLDAIIAGLGDRLLDGHQASGTTPELFSTRRTPPDTERSGYSLQDGVAVIHVTGALVHRSRHIAAESTRLLGYNELAMAAENALADPEVHAVLHVVDSPGGEVQGAFEYHDRMLAHRGKKPMHAIIDGLGASAGYLAASGNDQIAITATGYAGSIGVVMRHVDLSAAMAADGIRITHIYAGDHKVDGNPYETLPDDVKALFQDEIDSLYSEFIDAVATARQLPEQAVRDQQAAIYRGTAAVQHGLADRISTTDNMIRELAALRKRKTYVL